MQPVIETPAEATLYGKQNVLQFQTFSSQLQQTFVSKSTCNLQTREKSTKDQSSLVLTQNVSTKPPAVQKSPHMT